MLFIKSFADNVAKFETEKSFNFETINIGVDFGGNKSKHAFCCTGITKGYKELIALASEKHEPDTPERLNAQFIDFVKKMLYKYGRIDCIYCDSAEQVLIRGMQKALQDNNLNIAIKNAIKNEIINRIRIVNVLMTTSRFFYIKNENASLVDALQSAVWDSKSLEDKRLDDNTSDIDTLDSFEYSFEKYIKVLSMI